jgi:DNA-binding NarL/FixJ family response regulator
MGAAPTEGAQWWEVVADVGYELHAPPAGRGSSAALPGSDSESAFYVVRAAIAAERARIAHELHESVNKSLLGIAMIAGSIFPLRSPADPQSLERRLRELARLAQGAVAETRGVISDLADDAPGVRPGPGKGTRIAVEINVPAPRGPGLRAVRTGCAVRVVIAEENPVLRSGLRAVFAQAPGIEVVGEAANDMQAVEEVCRHRPDVLLLNAGMPLASSLETIRKISRVTEVVVLTCSDDASLAARAMAGAGARLYALRGELEPAELIQMVRDAALRGPAAVPDAVAGPGHHTQEGGGNGRAGRNQASGLTPREREVMELIAEGLSNRQIAARLVISEKTVKNHICSIYQRIGVYERSEAVDRWRAR